MKKDCFRNLAYSCVRSLCFILIGLFVWSGAYSQLATWPLNSTSKYTATPVAANVTAGSFLPDPNFGSSFSNTSLYKAKQSNSWPSTQAPSSATFSLDFPLSPKAGYDLDVTGLTATIYSVTIATSGATFTFTPYFQIDGQGNWTAFGTPQTISASTAANATINFGTINLPLYNTHTYVIRIFVSSTTGATKNDYFNIGTVVFAGNATTASTKPTVALASAVKTGKYTGNGVGTYTYTGAQLVNSGKQLVYQSGVCWSTVSGAETAAAGGNFTTDGTNGVINSTITGLTANTKYYVKAYIITQLDTTYSTELSFTTDPPSIPALTTTPAGTPVPSNKAISGGTITDSGGLAITQKGVCWSATQGAETAGAGGTFTIDGTGSTSFSSILKILTPNTTYWAKAYATNTLGTGYGNEIAFTTSGPVPSVIAIPSSLNFGTANYGSTPPVQPYSLSGTYLTPATGSITATAPAGYTISLSPASGFGTTLSIPYSNSTLSATNVYVRLSTSAYGVFNGAVYHTGGGTTTQTADSVTVTGSIVQSSSFLNNMGTDFWTGFGYEEKMNQKSGSSSEASMSIYVTTGNQAATVHVESAGAAYSQTYTIPANSYHEFTNFPTGDPNSNTDAAGLPDSRLFSTGISNKSVHIYSDNNVPVAAFLHTYTTSNTAAGAMLFPTNTWNSSYTVQAYGGVSNSSNPNSFFFVIANQDNTVVTFTPTQPIIDANSSFSSGQTTSANTAYAAGGTYTVTLNKGQVFNAMGGFGASNNGLDLSGTTVKTTCDKKIAVFGGNGRVYVSTNGCSPSSGSDNLIQQMFPKVAWGTEYLTVPTKTMEYNYYRIFIQDPTTVVTVNGTQLSAASLVNNLYYNYESNQPLKIISDQPVNVTQFIIASQCAQSNGSKGSGDPEMIILSPVQQAITSATVYSAQFKTIPATVATANGSIGNCASFINVVIPTSAVSSFQLDGLSSADTGTAAPAVACTPNGNCTAFSASTIKLPMTQAFRPHPQDANYSIAKFWVTTGVPHTLSASAGFNAIAYGLGNGESYGYNAGTSINDLTAITTTQTPFGGSNSATTCQSNPTTINVSLPYSPSQLTGITWSVGNNPKVTPNNDTVVNTPASTGTFVNNGRTYYTYASPRQYSFNDVTTFPITLTVSGTFASDCGSSTTININMTVVKDTADFTMTPVSCGSKQIQFKDSTGNYPGDTTKQWIWNFGDGVGTSAQQNPTYTYANKQQYTIKLRVINNIGCYADTSKTIDLSGNVTASFTVNQDTCLGGVTTFTSTSTATAGGAIQKYHWNFGETGAADSIVTDNNNPPAQVKHRYAAAGTYKASLWVETAQGCTSAGDTMTIVIRPTPVADFIPPAGICLPGSTSFINKSDTAVSGTLTYVWNFGDNTTSTIKDPVHSYASAGTGSYSVSLVATSQYGCTSNPKTIAITGIYNQPTAKFTVTQSPLCSNDSIAFIDGSLTNAPAGDNSYIKQWKWFFGDNTTSTLQDPNHKYGSANSFKVQLLAYTDKGCVSDTTSTIITTVQSPKVVFAAQRGICLDASPRAITGASETTGQSGSFAYSGTGVTGTTFNPQTAGAGTFPVLATYTAANGCKDTASSPVTVWALPVAGFTVSNPLCQNATVQFTDTSKSNAAIGKIKTWAWDLDDNTTSQTQNPTHIYPTGKNYTISLKVMADSGCYSLPVSQIITVNPLPVPGFTIPTDVCLPNGTAVFTNTSYVSTDPQANLSSVWDFGDPNDPTSSTFTNGTHKYSAVNSYQVKLTVTYKGCSADTTITLPAANIHPQPQADFKADPAEVCIGKPIQFNDLSDGLTSAVTSWTWNFNDGSPVNQTQNPSYTYTKAGSYAVTLVIYNKQGCVSNTATHTVTIDALPVVDAGPDQYVLQGRSVTLQPNVSGTNLSFQWSPPDFLDDPATENPVCTPAADKAYNLTVTAHGGCTASDSVHVWLLQPPLIPNVFSPNGDGINDYWQIQYLSRYPGCTVQVYDRNGQLVFTSTGYQLPWDGKFKDQPLPVATYYYIIDPKNGRDRISGSVTILR